ncbi:hypothetical protein XENOCAPTIV_026292 [Xenoophorus captivus]|uniref:Uncharacterized protein n=1 Tax=Xenoophorus captivus TaxID=1517983 RepID=A0ABV0QVA0_9TELE
MWDLETKEVYRVSLLIQNVLFCLCCSPVGVTGSRIQFCLSDTLLWVLLIIEIHRPLHGCDDPALCHHTTSRQQRPLLPLRSSTRSTAQCLAVRLAVVCKDGQLHLFEHFLNGPCKKPLLPSCSVQMSDTKDSPMPIPLLAAALGADPRSVLLAYGSHLQPVMEKVLWLPDYHLLFLPPLQEINMAERHVCLTRDVKTTLSLSVETTVSKVTRLS